VGTRPRVRRHLRLHSKLTVQHFSLRRRALILATASAMLGVACARESTTSAPADPSFEWFEYTGNDSALAGDASDSASYHNPVLAGFYPDPSICRVGDDYYLVTSSFSWFPGVPIFHSRDLTHWTQIGSVLDRPSQLPLDSAGVSRGIFAPTIRHHDGVFYMITTLIDRGGSFIVTATDPAGPWSEPNYLGFDGIDPDIFFDSDGRAWVVNNGPPDETPRYDGHRAIWIQEYDLTRKAMVGERSVIVNGGVDISKRPVWIEAPHLLRVNGWYYLIAAEGGTAENHSEVVLRSKAIRGPYIPYAGNPILTQRHLDASRPNPVTSTGHADFVQTPAGDWWAVFLGTRPYRGDFYNTGRETFLLPVDWSGEWPVILRGNATVPYTARRPALPLQPAGPIPLSGNFTYRDEFADSTLRRDWELLRTPRESWYTLANGALTLRARPVPIDGNQQPSFIARRQQHLTMTATTAMRYAPQRDGDRAGLVAFQNERYYFFVGLAREEGKDVLVLEQGNPDSTSTAPKRIATVPRPPGASDTTYLRIAANGDRYSVSFAVTPDNWTALGPDLDGTLLSTKVAGGFVGTMIGPYAFKAP